jgi:hypothetical protein
MMEVKLPDVCRLQYGFAFDSAQFSTTTGTPLVRIRDIHSTLAREPCLIKPASMPPYSQQQN